MLRLYPLAVARSPRWPCWPHESPGPLGSFGVLRPIAGRLQSDLLQRRQLFHYAPTWSALPGQGCCWCGATILLASHPELGEERSWSYLLKLHLNRVTYLKLPWRRSRKVRKVPHIRRLIAYHHRDDKRLILLHESDAGVVHHLPGVDLPLATKLAKLQVIATAPGAETLRRVLVLSTSIAELCHQPLLIHGIPEGPGYLIGRRNRFGHCSPSIHSGMLER